ncbi:hypothetical protein ONZ45_g2460 [Pleurotus djamor]|nr:hypothetical protein ONZ45_g2460 [Pleurotus djamor]
MICTLPLTAKSRSGNLWSSSMDFCTLNLCNAPIISGMNMATSGSKRNWKSLAKAFSRELHRPVYTLDLRNHGSSPHVHGMTYSHMAADVLHFCQKHNLQDISLIGHSMGGKVSMTVALDPLLPPALLSNLIVVDIAPSIGSLSSEFMGYLKGMQAIEHQGIKSRKDADLFLHKWEKDPSVRAFLLTNFVSPTSQSPHAKFQVPLNILASAIPELGLFPYQPGERIWPGRTMFIKGEKSKLRNDPLWTSSFHPDHYFPNMILEKLDTGHWVHAEE